MCPTTRMWLSILLHFVIFDGVLPRQEGELRRARHTGDLDTGWTHVIGSDVIPDYDYKPLPTTRPFSSPQDSRHLATIPNLRSLPVNHRREVSYKLYNGRIKAAVYDRPRKRSQLNHRLRHSGSTHEHWQYSQDQPSPSYQPRVCVRCPGDRAVLATKGSTSVLMDTPPIIPCYPWSSVEKVKSEVLAGPQPGTKMVEGSHKMMIRVFRHKRTLATCVIRYNVIVRKCPELELNPGVKADCPLGKAWGSNCNLTCEPGYLLEGDSSTECSDDLEWTGVQPQCTLSTACPAPASPEHGHLSCRTPQHQPLFLQGVSMLPDGTVCHFRCQSGYIVPPEQAHLTRMRCIAGSWDSDQDPICVETNELEEEEEPPPDISIEDALRLDGKNCPEGFCLNGGKCLTILDEPMCSCQPGFLGSQCEEEDSSTETEDNTIT